MSVKEEMDKLRELVKRNGDIGALEALSWIDEIERLQSIEDDYKKQSKLVSSQGILLMEQEEKIEELAAEVSKLRSFLADAAIETLEEIKRNILGGK